MRFGIEGWFKTVKWVYIVCVQTAFERFLTYNMQA